MKKSKGSSFRGKTRRNAENSRKRGGLNYLKLPDGVDLFTPDMDSKVDMDIMPYTVSDKHHPDRDTESEIAIEGTLWYKRPFTIHRNIGAKNDQVVCPATIGKKCPICEYRDKLRKEDGDEETIRSLAQSDKVMYAVIIKNNKRIDDQKVHLFVFSDYLFQKRFEEQLKDDEKFEIFPDHQEGYTLRVRFAENNIGTNKFADPTRFDFVDRKEQYDDSILEEVPDLDNLLVILDYKDLKAKFLEGISDEDVEDDDVEEEEDEKPAKRTQRSKPQSKRKIEEDDEEEDEEEEDDEEEDEEEEDEKPARQRKRKAINNPEPKGKSKKPLECPEGHKFGKDADKFDDCEDCAVWNECYAEKKKSKK
jgi:hypothetical protein